jgi:hypothetical protein
MTAIRKRWKAQTPPFFKKVINIGLTVGMIGTAVVTMPIALPVALVAAGSYMAAVGVTAATVAKLAKR